MDSPAAFAQRRLKARLKLLKANFAVLMKGEEIEELKIKFAKDKLKLLACKRGLGAEGLEGLEKELHAELTALETKLAAMKKEEEIQKIPIENVKLELKVLKRALAEEDLENCPPTE